MVSGFDVSVISSARGGAEAQIVVRYPIARGGYRRNGERRLASQTHHVRRVKPGVYSTQDGRTFSLPL